MLPRYNRTPAEPERRSILGPIYILILVIALSFLVTYAFSMYSEKYPAVFNEDLFLPIGLPNQMRRESFNYNKANFIQNNKTTNNTKLSPILGKKNLQNSNLEDDWNNDTGRPGFTANRLFNLFLTALAKNLTEDTTEEVEEIPITEAGISKPLKKEDKGSEVSSIKNDSWEVKLENGPDEVNRYQIVSETFTHDLAKLNVVKNNSEGSPSLGIKLREILKINKELVLKAEQQKQILDKENEKEGKTFQPDDKNNSEVSPKMIIKLDETVKVDEEVLIQGNDNNNTSKEEDECEGNECEPEEMDDENDSESSPKAELYLNNIVKTDEQDNGNNITREEEDECEGDEECEAEDETDDEEDSESSPDAGIYDNEIVKKNKDILIKGNKILSRNRKIPKPYNENIKPQEEKGHNDDFYYSEGLDNNVEPLQHHVEEHDHAMGKCRAHNNILVEDNIPVYNADTDGVSDFWIKVSKLDGK